ncbi:MAG TPA: aldehyde dehydrogenase family protein [Azospirillaceae bacterium]|nr:aldehyde dehydrogenase family protein [Azospirillaceae bacterium]
MTARPRQDLDPAKEALDALRAAEARDGRLDVTARKDLLRRLEHALIRRQDAMVRAVDADFGGREPMETLAAEVLVVVNAIRHARRHVARWARPRRVSAGLPFWPSAVRIVPQPLGVVGILSPWNYPAQLALSPVVSALAAGNRVAVKPSEATPRTAEILSGLLDAALGPSVARTVLGGPDVAAAFSRQPFDHLLFTGSAATGRSVMRAAAENLTPVTLELGGKCPAIVMPDADPAAAAREIVLGKGFNAGQTCVAPDTVLVVGRDAQAFCDAARAAHARHYPDGLGTAIASDRHAARLDGLVEGARVAPFGTGAGTGTGRRRPLALAPDPPPGAALLHEEVFGPVLPVVAVPDLDAAIAWVRARAAPLAIYLFSDDRAAEARLLDGTVSGALVVNGTIAHAAMDGLPFGGVGGSGFGRYHGEAGFLTFSNMRGHVRQARWSLSRLAAPPYGPGTERLIRMLIGRPGRGKDVQG